MKFRKRPIVVEAEPVSRLLAWAKADWDALPAWMRSAYDRGEVIFLGGYASILARGVWQNACGEDWVVRGHLGELYVVESRAFYEIYELVPQES